MSILLLHLHVPLPSLILLFPRLFLLPLNFISTTTSLENHRSYLLFMVTIFPPPLISHLYHLRPFSLQIKLSLSTLLIFSSIDNTSFYSVGYDHLSLKSFKPKSFLAILQLISEQAFLKPFLHPLVLI
jgi:hypothetical protein